MAWIARYNSVGSLQQRASTPAAAPRGVSATLSLQFIVIGVTAAYQFMVVEAAAKMATLGGRASFTLLPVLWCVADEMTEAIVPHLSPSGSSLKLAACSTMQELTRKISTAANGWQRDAVKVVVLTTLPGGSAHVRVLSRLETALHAAAARHFWFSQGLTGRLMGVLGQSSVVDVHVAPLFLNHGARSEMESLVGTLVPSVDARRTLPDAEQALVMSNVKVSNPGVQNVRDSDLAGPIDGWWCEAATTPTKSSGPVSVFAKLPSLLCQRIFEDRVLTAEEEELVASMTMKHQSAGEVRSVNRHFHHRWLGLEGMPLAGSLQRAYPCLPWILSATGGIGMSHHWQCLWFSTFLPFL